MSQGTVSTQFGLCLADELQSLASWLEVVMPACSLLGYVVHDEHSSRRRASTSSMQGLRHGFVLRVIYTTLRRLFDFHPAGVSPHVVRRRASSSSSLAGLDIGMPSSVRLSPSPCSSSAASGPAKQSLPQLAAGASSSSAAFRLPRAGASCHLPGVDVLGSSRHDSIRATGDKG